MRIWIPPEDSDPTVLQEPNRKGISVFGAVGISDGRLSTRITDKYNTLTFMHFLEQVHKDFPDAVFILDNAKYHHSRLVTEFAKFLGIELLFLPPYSPDLNPIERVWKFVRKHATHNKYFQILEELRSALDEQFGIYHKENEVLKKLCAVT